MARKNKSKDNYQKTRQAVGYVSRKEATQKTYDALGFKSGLEVHQQLATKEKLFCHCPSGSFNGNKEFDAEIVRHMRPTLSEMGGYDGTALMEFKTKKTIIYRINNDNTCTYDIDDTPPFPLNKEALDIATRISLLSKLNIVGEVHITRKQYLDGSIPAGFQRTAIIGVEGEIQLPKKKIRLIQLSLEEDSCREISDVGHTRIYKTDRLGVPLIETVTYPDMVNPDEVKEACDYIRFLNRSTGLVRTGIGAGRQDVNVSCAGGTRVEIKGVAHTKWIPELTHNEVFRQWALLQIRDLLKQRTTPKKWKQKAIQIKSEEIHLPGPLKRKVIDEDLQLWVVNLPFFDGVMSYFTQPNQMFADEIAGRLKVIACLERPNFYHTEEFSSKIKQADWKKLAKKLKAKEQDAQILFWAPQDDVATALEVIEERCLMAFDGVPQETRKSFEDGTTIFERVLPGADRMYPDTDSAPIPLEDKDIEELGKNLPMEIIKSYEQLKKWRIPEDTYTYIFSKNLYPIIKDIIGKLKFDTRFTGVFLGHYLKFVEGHYFSPHSFNYKLLFKMFEFIKAEKLHPNIAYAMLPVLYEHPQMQFTSILTTINYKSLSKKELFEKVDFLNKKFEEVKRLDTLEAKTAWVMGQIRKQALGNIALHELSDYIKKSSKK